MSAILIIDDDTALCRSLEIQLSSLGHDVRWAATAAEGLAAMEAQPPDLVFLDVHLPDRSGVDALPEILEAGTAAPVVLITGRQDMQAVITAMRAGAFDYIRKPLDIDKVLQVIEKALRPPSAGGEAGGAGGAVTGDRPFEAAGPYEIVGADRAIAEVVKRIGLLSRSRENVLIEGETGTGKELAARALHEAGSPGRPFVAINCSALVPSLMESELFGHEKGAFTGAVTDKTGKLAHAGEGTLFFDEIGDMPLELQARILRVLQEREFERVGGLEPVPFRARVVAATHHDLEARAAEGTFRRDLFYRLAVSRITLPPLRDRKGDIPLIVRHLLDRIRSRLHRRIEGLDEVALRRLAAYDWPGNVRELENVLTRAAALARGPIIADEELAASLGETGRMTAHGPAADRGVVGGTHGGAEVPGAEQKPGAKGASGEAAVSTLEEAVKAHIFKALETTGWNITRTARLLRISPTTLRKKIADFGLRSSE